MSNPFTPSFGVTPPLLVGRDNIIADFEEGLADGVGSPSRAMLITGTRGSGKTVLLNALEDVARHHGWLVISLTARKGLLDELTQDILPSALARYRASAQRSIKQVSATVLGVGAGVTLNDSPQAASGLRTSLFELTDIFTEQGAGVLITVDEAHRSAVDDLRPLTQEIQHAFRRGKNIGFCAAGLPEAVSDLLNDEVLTFLRRAERVELGTVSSEDIEQALSIPASANGRDFAPDALATAVEGTRGYPFLIQSVGFECWRASRGAESIGKQQAVDGVKAATRRVGHLVHEPALATLSNVDKSFLAAMAVDSESSRVSDIIERLQISNQYANTYRRRLMEFEIIYSPRHGYLDFTIPYLREYLREHAASEHFLS
ncbi:MULTISPECIES: ATP-binding protein [unclassified Rothia (in: high G+C Gram-positive bacteria)]|uniref:ATP-binding protein n=1 Tax=unclassified Rothia (in: high G+C Gram-positive bacteria) TaxID=2689056 RepID=UPI00195F1415|nr:MULTISPECIES: ATP-binding protein [unclassified Rothia (in: high G+C Gram-positive bacteria)]MBM7052203.1 ATP-binding protein [Rothia sp. ZJ1223]QRZ61357.1 ATP-binding protein [Rothia sp. ZJ932]